MGTPGAKAHLNGKRGPDKRPRKGSPRRFERVDTEAGAASEAERVARARLLSLVVAGKTIRQASEVLGVSRNTVAAWLLDPEVVAAAQAAQAASLAEAREILLSSARTAATRLCEYAEGTVIRPENAEIRACEAILDRVGVTTTQHVEVKVDDLRAKTDADLAAIVARGRPAPVREGEA